jgi:hypothetical protein
MVHLDTPIAGGLLRDRFTDPGLDPFPDVETLVTSLLTEEGGKTRLTISALYPSLEVRDSVLKAP